MEGLPPFMDPAQVEGALTFEYAAGIKVSNLHQKAWEDLVLESSCHLAWMNYQHNRTSRSVNHRLLPNLEYLGRTGRDYEILRDIYSIEQKMDRLYETDQNYQLGGNYKTEKTFYLRNLARDIKGRKHFYYCKHHGYKKCFLAKKPCSSFKNFGKRPRFRRTR